MLHMELEEDNEKIQDRAEHNGPGNFSRTGRLFVARWLQDSPGGDVPC